MYALAVLAFLVAVRNPGVWGYILRTPSSLDVRSLESWLSFGAWPVVFAVAAWAAMLGLGRRALGAAGIRPEGSLDAIAAATLGLGVIGQSVFMLGWLGGLNKPCMIALLAAATAAGFSGLSRPSGAWGRIRLNGYTEAAAGLLAFVVFHLLIISLAPTTAWDVRAYHLALPELYLRSGRLVEVPCVHDLGCPA